MVSFSMWRQNVQNYRYQNRYNILFCSYLLPQTKRWYSTEMLYAEREEIELKQRPYGMRGSIEEPTLYKTMRLFYAWFLSIQCTYSTSFPSADLQNMLYNPSQMRNVKIWINQVWILQLSQMDTGSRYRMSNFKTSWRKQIYYF